MWQNGQTGWKIGKRADRLKKWLNKSQEACAMLRRLKNSYIWWRYKRIKDVSSFICFIGYLMYFIFHTLKFHDPFILLKGRSLRSIRFWVLKDASLKKFWFSMSPIRKSKAVFLLCWIEVHLYICDFAEKMTYVIRKNTHFMGTS